MSKKFGKFLLFSAIAGAAAYGAYYYLQSKEKASAEAGNNDVDDDYDDFTEDLDEEVTPAKERSYVSLNLDKAEAFASGAFQKAKEVIVDSVQQVKDTVKSVAETQSVSNGNFTDITDLNKEADEPFTFQTAETPPVNEGETVEEFFDDENQDDANQSDETQE